MGDGVAGTGTSGHEPGVDPAPPSTLIGICGGSGSGKTTLAERLVGALGPEAATQFSFDHYYRDLAHLTIDERRVLNFDHPDSLDADLLVEHLTALQAGRSVALPVYDFATYTRSTGLVLVEPRPFVIVEGVLLLAFPEVRGLLDVTVFRQCDEATRADRRFRRDVSERGRSPESVRHQWRTTVEPMYRIHVEPHAVEADVVVDGERDLDAVVAELATDLRSGTAGPARRA